MQLCWSVPDFRKGTPYSFMLQEVAKRLALGGVPSCKTLPQNVPVQSISAWKRECEINADDNIHTDSSSFVNQYLLFVCFLYTTN